MKKAIVSVIVMLVAGGLSAQLPMGAPAPATRPTTRPARLSLDRAKRQVVIPAVVELQKGPLEFFLCSKGAKDHETVLTTTARPATLHAALLALGLTAGRPGRWVTPPAGGDAVFVSPAGAMVDIELRWTGADGKARRVAATDWLSQANKKIKAGDLKWVFVGSDFLDDDRYWADVEGMFISLANFPAAVIDVPFKSSSEAAFLEFSCAPKGIPKRGTKVDVIITAPKDQQKAADARINFTVDAFGRITLDGTPITPDAIAPAVKRVLARHTRGAADVRLDPRAMIYDRDRLEVLLGDAGLTDVSFRTKRLNNDLLPRDPAEATKALKWWAEQLAGAEDMLLDPGDDVEALLKHIAVRRKQVAANTALWDDYGARLKAMLAEHRKKHPAEPKEP